MEDRRRFTETPRMTEMQRILVRGNLLTKKYKLEDESAKYLSADAFAIKFLISLGLGAWFLFLRVLSFGYPMMTDEMLADKSLRIAGTIMYWPLYAVGILIPILIWSLIKKIRVELKIRRIDKLLYETRRPVDLEGSPA